MKIEKNKKEIDIIIHERNHLWNALILTIGGTLTLILFTTKIIFHYSLIFVGILFIIIFINGYFKKGDVLRKLLNKIEKED